MTSYLKRFDNNRGKIVPNGNKLGGNTPSWKNCNMAKKGKVGKKEKQKR